MASDSTGGGLMFPAAQQYLDPVPPTTLDEHLRLQAAATTTRLVVDYSTSRPTQSALDQVGALGCGRYVSNPGGLDKDISLAEATQLRDWNKTTFIYWEDATDDALAGRAAGKVMAAYAQDAVANRGGPADGGVIYASVDFDVQPAQIPVMLDWFRGWRDVRPVERCGVYGSLAAVGAVLDAGLADYACQTRAWSAGIWDDRAQLQQYAWTSLSDGSQVDLLRVMADDYGQWELEVSAADVWTYQVPVPAGMASRFASASYPAAELLYGARLLAGDALSAAKAAGAKADLALAKLNPLVDDEAAILAAVAEAKQAILDATLAGVDIATLEATVTTALSRLTATTTLGKTIL